MTATQAPIGTVWPSGRRRRVSKRTIATLRPTGETLRTCVSTTALLG